MGGYQVILHGGRSLRISYLFRGCHLQKAAQKDKISHKNTINIWIQNEVLCR